MTGRCPHCRKDISIRDYDLDWHPSGRVGVCPECKKKVYISMESRTHVPGPKKGQLVRRFRKNKV